MPDLGDHHCLIMVTSGQEINLPQTYMYAQQSLANGLLTDSDVVESIIKQLSA